MLKNLGPVHACNPKKEGKQLRHKQFLEKECLFQKLQENKDTVPMFHKGREEREEDVTRHIPFLV